MVNESVLCDKFLPLCCIAVNWATKCKEIIIIIISSFYSFKNQ